MKTRLLRAVPALVLCGALDAAPPAPPPELDPPVAALFEALLAEGHPDLTPAAVTRSPAEEKMSAQLGALFNPDLRVVDLAGHKDELLRLGQYFPGPPERVFVYLHLEPGADPAVFDPYFTDPPETYEGLEALAGWLRVEELPTVALLSETRFIRGVHPPRYRAGNFTTEGDALHHGPSARTSFGVDGAPLQVGVISDGVTSLGLAQGTLDLPPVNVINPGTGDEGTAMLEIIHDLAPGAQLSFCAAGNSVASFGQAILALHAQGCDIICDDVGWYTEPFFEHSSLGNLVASLRAQRDYLHLSAAGNDGLRHHQQTFTDAGGDGFHDQALIARVPAGESLDVFMGWNEPTAFPPADDYDLYLHDINNSATAIAQSTTVGLVGEILLYTNTTGADQDVVLWIYHSSGSLNRELEVILENVGPAGWVYSNGISPVDAIFGHPGHGSVIAVASTDHATPNQIEIDCSQGPFTTLGMFQTPKPDCAAADGVTVSGVGGFGSPFYGTSAAAPHVAGVCALAWSRSPTLPAAAVENALKLPPFPAALDLPSTAPDGFDFLFGAGRPLADAWGQQLNVPPVVACPPGPFQCAQLIPEELNGLTVSDPDTTTATFVVTLGVTQGLLNVDESVPGGIAPGQTLGNGSPSVTVTAALNAINTTFAQPMGVTYIGNPVPGGTIQPDTLTVVANDGGASGFGGPLTAQGVTTLQVHEFAYLAWRHDHFSPAELGDPMASGDDADLDGDRYTTLWEFFIGGDPHQADAAGAFQHTVGAGSFTYRFRLSPEIQGPWYQVRASSNLVHWNPVPGITIQPHPTLPGLLQGVATQAIPGTPKHFIRIEFNPYQ